MGERISKDKYFLEMARTASLRSTCLRRRYGSVIVKDGRIISTGYNGSPRGWSNCTDVGICYRIQHNVPRGTGYELCKAVHSEANAIINGAPNEMKHATLYLFGTEADGSPVDAIDCCIMCKRMIINSGIDEVVFADANGIGSGHDGYGTRVVKVEDWINNEPTGNGY